VTVTLAFDEAGLRVTNLQVSPDPTKYKGLSADRGKDAPPAITTRLLQRLPLQKWTREFAATKSSALRKFASTEWDSIPVLQERLAQAGQGPRRSSVAFYGEVAKVYRAALVAHGSPTKAVAERWAVNQSRAATWVYRARLA